MKTPLWKAGALVLSMLGVCWGWALIALWVLGE